MTVQQITGIAAAAAAGIFFIQCMVLFLRRLQLDHNLNQNIILHGGKAVGEDTGNKEGGLMDVMDDQMTTVFYDRRRPDVTSSFAGIYVRLYQMDSGEIYDYYLQNQLMIGRVSEDGQAQLQLADPMVSRKHCRIYRQGEQILIQDLGSRNHTFLNGCMLEGTMPLTQGDVIRMGKSRLQFQCFVQ